MLDPLKQPTTVTLCGLPMHRNTSLHFYNVFISMHAPLRAHRHTTRNQGPEFPLALTLDTALIQVQTIIQSEQIDRSKLHKLLSVPDKHPGIPIRFNSR